MNSFADSLKVINWNTFLLPSIAKITAQNQRAKLIADYLKNSEEDYDIITLQEVFTKRAYRTITKTLKDKYPYHTGSPRRRWFKPVSSGLLILSKYPIVDTYFYMFSKMAHADRYSTKGALAVTIELSEKSKVQVITTHFQAQYGEKYETIRKGQYHYLKNTVLKNYHDPDLPMILTGDFNINKHRTQEYNPFINYLNLVDPIISGDITDTYDSRINNLVTVKKGKPEKIKTYDYIFLLPAQSGAHLRSTYILNPKGNYKIKRKHIKDGSLSDHLPVVSIIDLF